MAQPHCHQHAALGWEADRDLLARAGAKVTAVGGCCGLAGNFGAERGHYDGFSCRAQLDHLVGRRALHLAELLASGRR